MDGGVGSSMEENVCEGVSVQESGVSVGRECVWGDYLCGRCGESMSECRR